MARSKRKTGKGRKGSTEEADLIARLRAAEARGDEVEARRLARRILAEEEGNEEALAAARAVLDRQRLHPVYLAYAVGGLLLWALVFYLGVLLRR
ncbi:MAG: hypothetical protein D6729_19170 [Deltaproteobacteria bacterium]|nr:MAG: hypothetical protein D6729_19170 [Deltaproteobacteria bacterium]